MSFKVGDRVVYPHHGAAVIEKKEMREVFGEKKDAEVVRNLALRETTKGLSAGEKAMLVRARGILVSELSFALNVSEDEALAKLEQQLT